MFLLDTMAISELRKPRPDPGYVAWLEGQAADDLHLSTLSIGELRKGILMVQARRGSEFAAEIEAWFRHAVLDFFDSRILAFHQHAADAWARLVYDWPSPQTLPHLDSQIAAVGLANGLTVVTRNARDFLAFERRGVTILSPWRG